MQNFEVAVMWAYVGVRLALWQHDELSEDGRGMQLSLLLVEDIELARFSAGR